MPRGPGIAATVLGVALGLWCGAAGRAQSFSHTLISDRVNGVHSDLGAEISPVQIGPLTVRLRSPSHRLEVLEHEVRLGALDERVDAATIKARYQGEADLVAELEMAGVTSEIEDHIRVPLQETEIRGRIEIRREGEGYRLVAVEAPSHVEIEVESDLGSQMGTLCRGFAVMTLGSVDCAAVDAAFSRVRLPLPEAGREYFIPDSQLTEEEGRQLEGYLRGRRRAEPPASPAPAGSGEESALASPG